MLVDIQRERATVQLVVQIVSRVLAMLQMVALCSISNFAVRLWLGFQGGSVNLQKLGFWSSLNILRVDFSLSSFYMLGTAGFLAISLLPGAFVGWCTLACSGNKNTWSRNLDSGLLRSVQGDMEFPVCVEGRSERHNMEHRGYNCQRINDGRGFIPSCPVPDLQGLLLYSGSSATPVDGSVRNHSKLDDPIWQYRGRSYGVGSSVGLNSTHLDANNANTYHYTETGYNVTVSCMKNSSSNFGIKLGTTLGNLSVYYARGSLPNMYSAKLNGEDYGEIVPTFSLYDNYTNMAIWTAHKTHSISRTMIGVATGVHRYEKLNQTQCEVHFTPAKFEIAVNKTERSISVKPQYSVAVKDIDPTGQLQFVIMNSVNFLARMSPSLYVSVLGDSLERNFNAKKQQDRYLTDEEAVISSVVDTFTAIIDDILVAFGASQLLNVLDNITTVAQTHTPAVQIGKPIYIYLIAAFHFVIVSLWLVEAVRTRGWAQLSKLDHSDIKSVIVASSAGGHQLAQTVQTRHGNNDSRWAGDKSDPIVAETEIQLKWHKPGTSSSDPRDKHNDSRGEESEDDMIAIVRKSS